MEKIGKSEMPGESKYVCIIKVGNKENHEAHCVKYRSSNLLSMINFLDKEFPKWTWMNVFDSKNKEKLASYTTHNRPPHKYVV